MSGALADWAAGRVSPEVALARLVLDGVPPAEMAAMLPAGSSIASALARHAGGVERLAAMLRDSGVDHGGGSVDEVRRLFDVAVRQSPELSVAAYCLDDPELLRRGTAEIVDWLGREGLLVEGSAVLDVGCGIGRVAAALAPGMRSVVGVDIAPGMIEEARRRHGGRTNVRFAVAGPAGPWGEADLVLFVDSMPYLVQAGVADEGFRAAARAVGPGGAVAVLNLSYRGDPEADETTARGWADETGLRLDVCGLKPFRMWDGRAFVWRANRP